MEHLQQTGGNPTAFNPDIVMYPGNPELTNITQQLQQLSMAGGITVINNLAQIKEFSQGQMNNPAMEEDPIILAPPGQVQEQIVPVIDPQVPQPRPQIMAVDQDAASMELPVYQMAASPKGINIYSYTHTHTYIHTLTLVMLNPDIPCLCKQCRSRSVAF